MCKILHFYRDMRLESQPCLYRCLRDAVRASSAVEYHFHKAVCGASVGWREPKAGKTMAMKVMQIMGYLFAEVFQRWMLLEILSIICT